MSARKSRWIVAAVCGVLAVATGVGVVSVVISRITENRYIGLLSSNREEDVYNAVDMLSKRKSARGLPHLISLLKETRSLDSGIIVVRALGMYGPQGEPAISVLVSLLDDAPDIVIPSLITLSKLGEGSCVARDKIEKLQSHWNEAVRLEATKTLAVLRRCAQEQE